MIYKYKKPDPFYLSKPWRKVRAVALARDNFLCQRCLKRGRIKAAATVHHIKPRSSHPELALVLDNLQSLCWTCHNIVEPRGAVREGRWRVRARVIKG